MIIKRLKKSNFNANDSIKIKNYRYFKINVFSS